jgi:hypothetical protein
MRNLKLHDHSDKVTLLTTTIILIPQYMCPNGSEKPFKNYFAIGALTIQEVNFI